MAEVFGLAAGAVGVAPVFLELAKSVKKLQDLCQEVKTAPQEIQDLAEEVEGISEILVELEKCGLTKAPTQLPGMQLCLSQCSRANGQFSAVVSALEHHMMAHRLLARVTFPLKKEKIKKLTEKLERGKSALSLACNVYNMSEVQIQHQMLLNVLALVQQGASKSPRINDVSAVIPTSAQDKEIHAAIKPEAQRARRGFDSAEKLDGLQTTPSFLSLFWDMCFAAATRGWMLCLKSYRIVPWDTFAFQRCREGDLLGLQQSLCSREVSLRDQTVFGRTLFSTALLHQQMHIARWLQAMGTDVDSVDEWGDCSLAIFWIGVCVKGYRDHVQLEELRRNVLFLTEVCGLEAKSNATELSLKTLLRPCSLWTSEDRLNLAQALRPRGFQNDHGLQLVLESVTRESDLWHIKTSSGCQIIHCIAQECAHAWIPLAGTNQSWTAHLTLAVKAGSDLHAVEFGTSPDSGTPLHRFLWHILAGLKGLKGNLEDLNDALRAWVAALAAAGVDLITYGQRETAYWVLGFAEMYSPRIISFVYGPNWTDWRVLTEHPGDRYAGVFWDLVENPDKAVPGSWIEPDMRMWEDVFFQQEQESRARRRKRNGKIAYDVCYEN